MMNKIKNILKAVWNGLVAVSEIYNKIVMFPWRVVAKLWYWVYD